jgi:hypothetical protein
MVVEKTNNPVRKRVTLTATDPATGEVMHADLEHAGTPLPLDVLFGGMLRTALRSHGLRCIDMRQSNELLAGPGRSRGPQPAGGIPAGSKPTVTR